MKFLQLVVRVFSWALLGTVSLYGVAFCSGARVSDIMADKDYSKADLLAHYRAHQPQLTALRAYYDSLVPHNQHIEIEFEQDSVSRLWLGTPGMNYHDYHAGVDKRVTLDSVVQAYDWTPAQVRKLAEKLKQAGCISIGNGEPAQIGFQRSGMSRYSYHVFSQPLSDSLRKEYQGVWLYRFAHDKVALEEGGGATQLDRFLGKEDE